MISTRTYTAVVGLRFDFHWAPRMISAHLQTPLSDVDFIIAEHQAGQQAHNHADYLRSLPTECLGIRYGVPAGSRPLKGKHHGIHE